VFCLGVKNANAAGPVMSASASASWADNITRSPYIVAAHAAALFDVTGVAEWRSQVSRDVSLQFDANAGFESCPKYDGLDRVLAGVQFSAQRKFGLGPLAPALRAELSYTGNSYREAQRNSTRLIASLSWTKRWDDSWQTVLAAEYLRNDGRAPAYDYHNRGLSLEARYDVSERWQLAAGLRRQWGEQLTYAWLGGSGATFPYVFDIWRNTTEISTFGPNWNAYSIDAHADTLWFSISPALGGNRSLPLRFEQTSVVGRGESYRTGLISLSYVQRF
jgi:hypothetical protein